MADYIIQDTTLTGIANAIREKDGTSEPILTEDMPTRILAIPSGGGGITPEYTETKILNNQSLGTTITFTEDYHNYQMLKVVLYNSSTRNYESQFVLPEGIDKSILYSGNKINFNMLESSLYSNQYVAYTAGSGGTPSLTWTRYNSRNVFVYEVYGMTFTNVTLTKTVIYSRNAIASSSVSPTPPEGKTFFDFDAIIYMACTGSQDETQFARDWFMKDSIIMYEDVYYRVFVKYNNASMVRIKPTTIGGAPYFYMVGLNFT